MVKFVNEITPEQREASHPWIETWIEKGLCSDEANWGEWIQGARRCYNYISEPFPDTVVHVSSILAGTLIAPAMAHFNDNPGTIKLPLEHGTLIRAWREGSPDAWADDITINIVRPGQNSVAPSGKQRVFYGIAYNSDNAVHPAPWRQDGFTGEVTDAQDASGTVTVPMRVIRAHWYQHLNGQWNAAWHAHTGFYREIVGLEFDDDTWERDEAYTQAQMNNSWWWPQKHTIIVSDRPTEVHMRKVGQHRRIAHNPNGPSVLWADGYASYHWEGTEVPRHVIMTNMTVEEILREPNSEVRRCAIERKGWPEFVAEGDFTLIDSCPDPSNPGFTLNLYDLPGNVFPEPVRLVLCTNATLERDGTRRRFGLTVPVETTTAMEAAAWMFDEPIEAYAALQRAT